MNSWWLPKHNISNTRLFRAHLRFYLCPLFLIFFILFIFPPFAEAEISSPQVISITPSSGTSIPSQEILFTTTYSDPDGWDNLLYGLFLINNTIRSGGGFYGYYRRDKNKLYMYKDGAGWLGGVKPGSQNILENDYIRLDCSKTTVSGEGDTMTVRWAVTFKEAFAGKTYNMYMYAMDLSYAGTGWQKKRTWRVNSPPSLGTVTPSGSSSMPDEEVLFTTTYSDPDGWDDLLYGLFLINNTIRSRGGFYGYYRRDENKVYMYEHGVGWLGGVNPGSQNILENDYIRLDCSKTTVSGEGDTMTVRWAVTFKEAFAGKTYNMYMRAMDLSYVGTGWEKKGTWEVKEREPYGIKRLRGHGTFGNVNSGWATQGTFWQNKIKIDDIDSDGVEEIVLGNNQGFVHVLKYQNNNYIDTWKSGCLGWLVSSLATDDVDTDGDVEIIATEYRVNQCEIFFFDGKTKTKEGTIYLAYIFSVHTDDLDGDSIPEVIAGTTTGDIHIYDGETKLEKGVIEILGTVHALNSTDLNGDNKKEILAVADNHLFVFDGITRSRIFDYTNSCNLCTVEIEDIDNDGIKEIVTSDTGGYVYVLEFDNQTQSLNEEWRSPQLAGPIYTIKLNDLDDDGNVEIVAGAGKKLYIFDRVSEEEWESADFLSNIFDLEIGDPDGDGDKEVVLGLDIGYLYVLDGKAENKDVEWQDVGGRFYTLEVADIDGDNILEYISGDEMGYVYIFDGQTHHLQWRSERFEANITGLATHDIDVEEDDGMEFMLSSTTGIYIFNGETKQLKLKIDVDEPWGLVADDFDKDGHIEVATYSKVDKCLYSFNAKTGRQEWKSRYLGSYSGVFLKSGDFDDDEQIELAMTTGGSFGLFDAKRGEQEWQSPQLGVGGSRGLVFNDIDGDGLTEIIAQGHMSWHTVSHLSGPVIFDGRTKEIEYEDYKRWNYGLAIGDVDTDPSLEVITAIGAADWVGFSFMDGCSKKWEYGTGSLGEFVGCRDAIRVVDIDSDGRNEIVAGSDGYIITFRTPGTNPVGGDVSCPVVYMDIEDDIVLSGAVNINIQASDDTSVSKIECYIDGRLITELTQSFYQWSFDTTKYSDGQHVLKVIAYDLTGNTGVKMISIGIDNFQPKTPTVSGIVSPTYINPLIIRGTKPAYTSIWINGEEVVAYNNGKTWSMVVELNEGNNHFNIISKSYYGRESDPLPLTIILDSTPPQKPIVSVDRTTDYLDRLSAYWSSRDPETGIVEYRYAIGTQPGGQDILEWTSTGDATEITVEGLSLANNQTYYFVVEAKNGAGNWSQPGISDGITVHQYPPVITHFQPSKLTWFILRDTVDVSISATDPEGARLEYRISIDDSVISDWSSNTTYTWVTQDTDFGRHEIRIEAKDDRGGRAEENIHIFIRREAIDLPEHR